MEGLLSNLLQGNTIVILIIGYGNSLRQDDGAGLILADLIERECFKQHVPVEKIKVHQLMPELSQKIANETVNTVIFADTRVTQIDTNSNAGVHIDPIVTDNVSPSVGHHLSPATLLIYAKLLYNRQPSAWGATIPGINFDHGEDLSSLTQRALAQSHTSITHWLHQIASPD